MKHFGRVLLLMFAFVCLFCISTYAEENWDCTDGVDREGPGYSYSALRRTLTIKNINLTLGEGESVKLPANSILHFEGDCAIVSEDKSAVVTEGLFAINGQGTLKISGAEYGVEARDTVLFSNGITVSGTKAAVSGYVEADGGYQMTVSENGKEFYNQEYSAHKAVRTGQLYPVFVTMSRGGGASFYVKMFAPGEEVVISARPQYGYGLKQWRSPYVKLENPTSNVIRFKMPDKAVRVYGDFQRVYTVSVPKVEGGHVEFITEGNQYVPGQQVVLYAVPDTGYYFSHWTSDYGRFRDPLQAYAALTMPSINVTAKPVFVKGESYYLKVEIIGEGETNLSLGNFPQNKSVLVNAIPAEGYVFSGWMSEAGHFLSSSEAQTYFTMPGENVTITAVFTLQEEYKKELTVESLVGGTVNVTGGLYAPGMPITLKAEAKTGYRFVRWTIEPAEYADAFLDGEFAETEFLMPAEDVKISARFELLDPEAVAFYLSVGQSEGGTVTSEGSGEYLAGYEIALSAEADEGYYFAGWKSALGGEFENVVDANTIFYMPANDTKVTAVFSKIVDAGAVEQPPENTPLTDTEIGLGIENEYLSFGLSLFLCSGIAAGGTIYADLARKEAGIAAKPRRRRKTAENKHKKPRRTL
ncbi:MAG: InlB B-repeat-containing protein [Clostridia bacterium]|nr:InlB B-repeat-containing protein [Clostridia bacterium]